ncbi:MAG: universal stress protein [Thermoproteota archaeon]|nr:universal stress protein [Thermoproteota archaeon]
MLSKTKKKLSRLLVAMDGSELSMKVADYAITIAKKGEDNTQITALHVIHSQIKYLYSALITPSIRETIIEGAKQEAQEWLSQVKEKANEYNVELKVEFIVDPTSIIGAIVEYAERENIDLIVIGSRGLTGFRKLLLGSVASGVVTYAHCPVLVVK